MRKIDNSWWKNKSLEKKYKKSPNWSEMYNRLKQNEVTQMAKILKKGKKVKKSVAIEAPTKHRGRIADPDMVKARAEGKPVVVHLPPKLHARAKLASIAFNKNLSIVLRELLQEWTKKNAKKIAQVLDIDNDEEEEVTETEEEDTEDEDTETEESDEEESDEDEEEESDEDEDDE